MVCALSNDPGVVSDASRRDWPDRYSSGPHGWQYGTRDRNNLCGCTRGRPFQGSGNTPTGEVSSYGFQVKVDKRPAIPWPQRKSLKIEGLDLKERHLLAVVDAHGKPMESLWFRFKTYNSKHLCMFYDGYQGIGLDADGRHCPWCRSKYTD